MTPAHWVMLFTSAADAYLRVEQALEHEELPIGDLDVDLAIAQFEERQACLGQSFEAAMLRLKADLNQTEGEKVSDG